MSIYILIMILSTILGVMSIFAIVLTITKKPRLSITILTLVTSIPALILAVAFTVGSMDILGI